MHTLYPEVISDLRTFVANGCKDKNGFFWSDRTEYQLKARKMPLTDIIPDRFSLINSFGIDLSVYFFSDESEEERVYIASYYLDLPSKSIIAKSTTVSGVFEEAILFAQTEIAKMNAFINSKSV